MAGPDPMTDANMPKGFVPWRPFQKISHLKQKQNRPIASSKSFLPRHKNSVQNVKLRGSLDRKPHKSQRLLVPKKDRSKDGGQTGRPIYPGSEAVFHAHQKLAPPFRPSQSVLVKSARTHPITPPKHRFDGPRATPKVKETSQATKPCAPSSSSVDVFTVGQPRATSGSACQIFSCGEKGQGLRARRRFFGENIILKESPFFRFAHPITESSIQKSLAPLPYERYHLFLSFKGTVPGIENHLARIAETNAIPLQAPGVHDVARDEEEQDDEVVVSGMFETICRINHSCRPNACWIWDSKRQKMELKAIKNIPPGVEITASYLDDLMETRSVRQAQLLETFGFSCLCSACSASPTSIKASDANMLRYKTIRGQIESTIDSLAALSPPERKDSIKNVLRYNKEALEILDIEGQVVAKGDHLMQRFHSWAALGNRTGASGAASKAYRHYKMTIGEQALKGMKLQRWIDWPEESPDWIQ